MSEKRKEAMERSLSFSTGTVWGKSKEPIMSQIYPQCAYRTRPVICRQAKVMPTRFIKQDRSTVNETKRTNQTNKNKSKQLLPLYYMIAVEQVGTGSTSTTSFIKGYVISL